MSHYPLDDDDQPQLQWLEETINTVLDMFISSLCLLGKGVWMILTCWQKPDGE
jgi:hypothetical protein